MPMGARKIIARRAAFELPPNGVVNLGVGAPEGISSIAAEEKVTPYITLTTEAGDRFYKYTDANKGSGQMAIVLENRRQGGLRARMHLPRMAAQV